MSLPWLHVVGIGEDGRAGLGAAALAALDRADLVVGGRRHLALAAPLAGRSLAWRSPLVATIEDILAARGQQVVVLASGDPLWFGVGRLLGRHVAAGEMRVLPGLSAFTLAASRLGWPLETVVCTTVHARPVATLRRHLAPGRRLLVLAEDGGSPAAVAALLCDAGLGASRMQVLEHLGGAEERVVPGPAPGGSERFADLAVIAVEIAADAPGCLPTVAGLPDQAFEHDGQITKREVRAVVLARLAPLPGQLLWDVGAGSGSVAIEWLRGGEQMRAIAVERDPGRAGTIRANAERLGVPELVTVTGEAPAALDGLPAPDAVFIGGGVRDRRLVELCRARLRPGGRLVANAVTLDGERTLIEQQAAGGGELLRLEVSRARPLGVGLAWRPALPVTQLAWVKPGMGEAACAPAG